MSRAVAVIPKRWASWRGKGWARVYVFTPWLLADMFHAMGRFIFKRQFWQHDDLRYFLVLRLIVHVIMFYMPGDFFDEMI